MTTLPVQPERGQRVAEHLLAALDALVRKHRALGMHGEHGGLHAELITTEVAHQLTLARTAMHALPPP